MSISKKRKIIIDILLGTTFFFAIFIGIFLGLGLAATVNLGRLEDLTASSSALPTQIYDVNGRLITEFFSDEKRDLVSLDEVPDHLINAILTREDRDFYEHSGFSLRGLFRAGVHILMGQYSGGASTITQQVAGHRYCDRTEKTLTRKLVELWWALQLEREYTKDEILEFYINEMPLGHGTNGVEAASKFYFGHSVRDITVAESVLLINTYAKPTLYSPILNPDIARARQIEILDQMVSLGYVSRAEADKSFNDYWNNYDYTRINRNPWSERDDRAPWFSWYINKELEDLFQGAVDIYRGGLKVYTTLNLDYQEIADSLLTSQLENVNSKYKENTSNRLEFGDEFFVPVLNLLSLSFNIRDVYVSGGKQKIKAKQFFREDLNPVMDMVGTLFDINTVKQYSAKTYLNAEKAIRKNKVEGALVCIDSKTGYIYSMVGGSSFSSRTNWFNRAVDSKVQPGSSFKPLYYCAAIENEKVTPATLIVDKPVIFWNDDGTPYTPMNYKGKWYGSRLLRYCLAQSLNIPALKVLEKIGFDAAIDEASKLLGVTDLSEIERIFPRKFPLGLGVIEVSPLQMARAYATFANEGKMVEPLGIRYIEDRNGKVILEPEKELRARQKRLENQMKLMSPQTAYIMTSILKSSVDWGTLHAWAHFDRPIAGKTGTTQNWSDAWTIGFTPQLTTAVWIGFDNPGNSLGINFAGGLSAGPVWAKFMARAHKNLPVEEFNMPGGISTMEICSKSGLLPNPDGSCGDDVIQEIFISGTEPREFCDYHKKLNENRDQMLNVIRNTILLEDEPLDEPLSGISEGSDSEDDIIIIPNNPDESNPLLQ